MNNACNKICYEQSVSYKLYHIKGAYPQSDYSANLHYDTDLTVTYFKKGSGSVKIEGAHYDISEGDIILLNPDELHCFAVNDEPFHERITLYIKKSVLDNFSCSNKLSFEMFYNRKSGTGNLIPSEQVRLNRLDNMLEDILRCTQSEQVCGEVLAVCKIIELLTQLNAVASPCVKSELTASSENATVNEVLRFLNTNYLENLTVQSIADRFYLSKYYLCRLFKDNVGISLWDYVILRRIIYFNDLVKEGVPIEKACYKAGFRNYSNFFRLYKKHMNMTPLEFKKSGKTKLR